MMKQLVGLAGVLLATSAGAGQTIKATDAAGRWAIYVPLMRGGKIVVPRPYPETVSSNRAETRQLYRSPNGDSWFVFNFCTRKRFNCNGLHVHFVICAPLLAYCDYCSVGRQSIAS
jgi:hypothetical protein